MGRLKSTLFVAIIVASFVVLLGYAFLNLLSIHADVREEVAEPSLWVTTQAQREAEVMRHILLSPSLERESGVSLEERYELLYSRVDILMTERHYSFFAKIKADEMVRQVTALVQSMEPINKGPDRSANDVLAALQVLGPINDILSELTNQTNLFERSAQISRRADQAAALNLLFVSVLGAFVSGGIMSLLLLRNLRQLTRAQAELEEHRNELEAKVAARTLELRKALDVERRAREVYHAFVVTISHQFRTPVSIIHMIAQRLARATTPPPAETLRIKSERVLEAAQKLEQLLDGFLTASKLESPEMLLRKVDVDFKSIAQSAVRQISTRFPERLIREDYPDLPAMIEADPMLIEQVIANLLDNAAKYSQASSVIDIKLGLEEGRAVLWVTDRGIGIPQEAKPAIFERFYRAGNVHLYPGLGVGLTIARDIICRHGGDIDWASELGEGSIFKVWLPLIGVETDGSSASECDDPLYRG